MHHAACPGELTVTLDGMKVIPAGKVIVSGLAVAVPTNNLTNGVAELGAIQRQAML